jgi:hypothetical protein
VTGAASQVDETSLNKENDVAAILHEVSVDLWKGLPDGGVSTLRNGTRSHR